MEIIKAFLLVHYQISFMKVSRYIFVPLVCAVIFSFIIYLSSSDIQVGSLLICAFFSWLMAIVLLLFSDYKVRQMSQGSNLNDYEPQQHRKFTMLLPLEKAFELCIESVNTLNGAKIKTESFQNGEIVIRTKSTWVTYGNRVVYKLNKISENLTEVNLSSFPVPITAQADYGRGWKIVEDLSQFLREKDAEINRKVLIESAAILDNVYVKPFQKEKVER